MGLLDQAIFNFRGFGDNLLGSVGGAMGIGPREAPVVDLPAGGPAMPGGAPAAVSGTPQMPQGMPSPMPGGRMPPGGSMEQVQKQTQIDAVRNALVLNEMDQEQINEAWPKMVIGMGRKAPQLRRVLDPKRPPQKEEIAQLLDRAGIKPRAEGDQIVASSNLFSIGEEGQPQRGDEIVEGIKLEKPVRNEVQKRLLDNYRDYDTITRLYEEWDDRAFTLQGKAEETLAEYKDWVGISDKQEQELLGTRIVQKQRIDSMMLIWRKYITGVAGGEKEMKDIEATTLNTKLTPAQARASRDELMRKITRDRIVYSRMLKRGFIGGVNTDKKAYTANFKAERAKVDREMADFKKKFIEANKAQGIEATDKDALMYYNYKLQRMNQPR